ncbi:DUF424 family protein [Candidatus Pacearchaeota archaeon]|nr:DUF424 family protein [Candidatus Pacearchaeota archaeon]
MFVKIHKSYRTVVAVCDDEIIGKIFEEGIKQLDCRENFYKDRILNREELIKLLKMQALEDATFNIVGKNSVDAAIEAEIVREGNISKVQDIPFVLIF